MTEPVPSRIEFKVSLFVPTVNEGAKSRASVLKPENKPKKWEELGIRVPKLWAHPDCQFCGLVDAGKKAIERPNLKHQLTCRERAMGVKPFVRIPMFDSYGRDTGKFDDVERRGSFVGEAPTVSLTVPVRLVRMIPERDDDGNPIINEDTGKQEIRPVCTYDRKTYDAEEWVWNGDEWVPWFVFLKQKPPDPDAPPASEKMTPPYEMLKGSWLAFEKSKQEKKPTLDQVADTMAEMDVPW